MDSLFNIKKSLPLLKNKNMITLTGETFFNKINISHYKSQKLFIQHLQTLLIENNINCNIQINSNHLILTLRSFKKIDIDLYAEIKDRWSIDEVDTFIHNDKTNYGYIIKFK